MKKVFLFLSVMLGACATTPTTWTDISGQGRGDGGLQMSSARCDMYAQQIADNYLQNNSPGACRTCGALAAITIINVKQNAYRTCMQAEGWTPNQ